MASSKKTAARGKKAKKPTPAPKKSPPAKPAKPKVNEKAKLAQQKKLQQQREAERKAAEKAAQEKRLAQLKDQMEKNLEREVEKARKEEQRKAEAALKELQRQWDAQKREAEKAAERAKREEEKRLEAEAKARAKAEAQAAKEAERAAAQAAKAAGKKKPIAMSSLAATPVIRPIGEESAVAAPPPPPAKPGHVDHQVLSAISYGLFAAVNKAFGFAGQSVVKNAALRMLEFGYKKGWLPPKSKEPIRALNEFFGRLETMGYAERIHVAKRGDNHVLEVHGLADFDALHELRSMHYPLLPIFLGEMLQAIVDQYFGLVVTMEPIELSEQKRGMNIPFSLHEKPTAPEVSRLPALSRIDDFEE